GVDLGKPYRNRPASARRRSSLQARPKLQRKSVGSRAGSAWIPAGTSNWAESKSFRLEVHRRYVHRAGPSCACEYAVSDGTGDASGSKPLPSRNDVHYVADSPGVGKTHLAVALADASI